MRGRVPANLHPSSSSRMMRIRPMVCPPVEGQSLLVYHFATAAQFNPFTAPKKLQKEKFFRKVGTTAIFPRLI
jgi:hypothetical protein